MATFTGVAGGIVVFIFAAGLIGLTKWQMPNARKKQAEAMKRCYEIWAAMVEKQKIADGP